MWDAANLSACSGETIDGILVVLAGEIRRAARLPEVLTAAFKEAGGRLSGWSVSVPMLGRYCNVLAVLTGGTLRLR